MFDTPQQSELYQHVMGLSPKYRAAVYLYYYEDCPYRRSRRPWGQSVHRADLAHAGQGKLKLILQEAES
ncbi:MAG: hypothetical protein ACLTYN_06210 [Dysosmobacter welbionis]